ncbi:MAG: translation initiation factor IF-3 [Ilumatobacteraceae bacterium]
MAPPKSDQHRVNDRIRAREVRLIGPDGNQLGIKPVPDALKMARGLDLDLVEVAPMANPPVCRIMDYGKFRYEEAQKAKEARKKSSNVTVKEVKFRPKIGKGDFDTKVRHLIGFIEEGHKVKVTLQFRGREMAHPELGSRILDGVISAVGAAAKVENEARLEGRNMSMVLAPDKKAQEAIKKAAEEAAAAEAATDESTDAATDESTDGSTTDESTDESTDGSTDAGSAGAGSAGAPPAKTPVAVSASDGDDGSGERHAEDEDE